MLDHTVRTLQETRKKTDKAGYIAQLNLFSGSKDQLLTQIKKRIKGEGQSTGNASKLLTIATPNPEMVVQSVSDEEFGALLQEFDIRIPDGIGLVKAAQLVGALPASAERIPGVEVVAELLAEENLVSGAVYILGGREYAGARIGSWVVQDVSQVGIETEQKTLWWQHGFLERSDQTPEERQAIRTSIEAKNPTVLFVALGAPAQEQWLLHNREWLEAAGVQVAMVVGGAFDMLFGKIPRAPGWMQQGGLEWAYRLYQEPWRWRRQLRLVRFLTIVGKEWLATKK